jgi:hypothetical protein
MVNMELHLAASAPHDVVLVDGSLTTPFIYSNQAANQMDNVSSDLKAIYLEGKQKKSDEELPFPGVGNAFEGYAKILESSRSDKVFAGVPKYTTKNEICEKLGYSDYEDRSLLNLILRKDEFIGPFELGQPEQPWHIKKMEEITHTRGAVIELLKDLRVIYYKPSEFLPIMRLETSATVAQNKSRLAILLEAIRIQTVSPSVMEPYPLYLADRMVKHLSTALPAIRRASTQEMALKWEKDLSDVYLAMHGYRSEYGN